MFQVVFTLFLIVPSLVFAAGKNPKAPRVPAGKSSIAQTFRQSTGLQEGEYELTRGNDNDCLQGALELIESQGSLSLSIGGRPLVADFTAGKKTTTIKEECPATVVSEQTGNTLTVVRTFDVPEKKTKKTDKDDVPCSKSSSTVIVTIFPSALNYKISTSADGKAAPDITCDLTRIP